MILSRIIFLVGVSFLLLSLPVNPHAVISVNDALATSHEPVMIKQDRGSQHWDLDGSGSLTFVAGNVPTQTLDSSDSQWKSHVLTDNGNGDYEVQSGLISTRFVGTTISHYGEDNSGFAGTETPKLMRNTGGNNYVEIPLTFVSRTASESSQIKQVIVAGVTVDDVIDSVTVTETWTADTYGTLTIDYLFEEGKPLKHTFTMNQTSVGSETYRFYHYFDIDNVTHYLLKGLGEEKTPLPIGNVTLDKDSYQDILQQIAFFDVNGDMVITEIVAPNTSHPAWSDFIEVYAENDGTDKSAEFRYGTWTLSQGQNFELDPDTYTSSNPTVDGNVATGSSTGSPCPTSGYNRDDTSAAFLLERPQSASFASCRHSFVEYDTTSITDGSDVTNTVFKYEVTTVVNNGLNVSAYPMSLTTACSSRTAQQIYDDANDGTAYSVLSMTTGTNKSTDLGTTADSDVEATLDDDYFCIGVSYGTNVRLASQNAWQMVSEEGTGTPDPTLEITYTPPPPPVYNIDLIDVYQSSSTTLDSGTVVCQNVDTDSAQTCTGNLQEDLDYRFELEVDNTGSGSGTPTDFDYLDLVGAGDVLGSIVSGDVVDYGCGTNTDWTGLTVDSGGDGDIRTAVGSGTACTIGASSNVEYWVIINTDGGDMQGGSGTFFVDDGTVTDTSTATTFEIDRTNAESDPISMTDQLDLHLTITPSDPMSMTDQTDMSVMHLESDPMSMTDSVTPEKTSAPVPPTGGGGGSSRTVIQVEDIIDLTILTDLKNAILSQVINGVIKVQWDSGNNLEVTSIIADDSPFKITFEQVPFELVGNSELNVSEGEIRYSVSVPNNYCSLDLVTNCVESRLYEIPVEITATHDGVTITKNTLIKVDTTEQSQIPFIFVLLAIGVGIVGVGVKAFTGKHGNSHSKPKPRKGHERGSAKSKLKI